MHKPVIPLPNLDDRSYTDLVEEALALIPSYYPGWTDNNPSDPGITLIELLAWLAEMVLYRLNHIPQKNYKAFVKLVGGGDIKENQTAENGLERNIRETVLDLKKRYRAVTSEDYEFMALHRYTENISGQSKRPLARVKCLPNCNLER